MTCVATREISKGVWKLIILLALESQKKFLYLDNLVIFDEVYRIQLFSFDFQSLCIMQMMRQNA